MQEVGEQRGKGKERVSSPASVKYESDSECTSQIMFFRYLYFIDELDVLFWFSTRCMITDLKLVKRATLQTGAFKYVAQDNVRLTLTG